MRIILSYVLCIHFMHANRFFFSFLVVVIGERARYGQRNFVVYTGQAGMEDQLSHKILITKVG